MVAASASLALTRPPPIAQRYPRVAFVAEATECRCRAANCGCVAAFLTRNDWRHIDDVKPVASVTVSVDKRNQQLLVSGHVAAAPRDSVTIDLRFVADVHVRRRASVASSLLNSRQGRPRGDVALQLDPNWCV